MAKGGTKSATDVIAPDEMELIAKTIGKILEEFTGEQKGFALLLFDFGSGGSIQYCSNTDRTDMIAVLRELLGKWAAGGSIQN